MADCAVFILIHPADGTALMEDRPDLCPGSEHYWVYPGGKLLPGENPVTAMLRELYEETGCVGTNWHQIAGHGTTVEQPFSARRLEETPDAEPWYVHAYAVTSWDGVVPSRSLDDHHSELRWIDPQVIAEQDDTGHTAVVPLARLLLVTE